ncbi:unnamed protein product [Prorocentrum cordatum]|uniref:Uncharacterized protein n=1 Tax=Prorocentrum cordatum TaxID=2364126 RepID=A0ABN9VWK9_9DINO|nr:unnamed protein product [Polarella glacialis]
MLPKGAMCSVDAGELALPPPGAAPARIADICPLAAEYFSDVAGGMLREPSLAMDEELKGQKRLWGAGVLGTTDQLVEGVSLFGVIKKYLQEEADLLGPAKRQVRAIWDQRRANLRWQRPPCVPLGSPASFAHLDLSNLGEKDVVYTGVGDIPDMFHRLETPPEAWPYFVLEEVPVREFVDYVKTKGRECVLAMGWSWAPFLALSTPQACMARGPGGDSVGARLAHGAPTPQLIGPDGFESVSWAYMDDHGVLATSASAQQPVGEENEGEGLESLGAVIRGRPYTVSAEIDRTCGLALVTSRVVERTCWTAELLERIVVPWARAALFQRTGLAIFDQVYHEMRRPETAKTPFRLSDAARWELTTIAYCAPLLRTDLEAPWLAQAFMADSSDTGYGVAVTDASPEEIREDARYSEMRGWTIATEHTYTGQEEGAGGGDMEGAIHSRAELDGYEVQVWSIDAVIDPKHDLTNDEFVGVFLGLARGGYFHAVIASSPCSTWSRARFLGKGSKPLRTRLEPWGRSDMSFTAFERLRLDLGARLLPAAMQAVREVCLAGGLGLMEHPADPVEDPYPSIWNFPEMASLLEETGGQINRIDQRRYGAPSMKPTMIGIFGFYDDALDLAADCLRLRCNHRAASGRTQGKSGTGPSRLLHRLRPGVPAAAVRRAGSGDPQGVRPRDEGGARPRPNGLADISIYGVLQPAEAVCPVGAVRPRPPKAGDVPLQKRGPRAWGNCERGPHLGISEGGSTRLLAHSAADVTATQWAPKARDFLDYCVDEGWGLRSASAVGHALADYMGVKCYRGRLRPAWGSIVLFGLLVIWLELRLVVSVEGGPLPEEAVFAIAIYFFGAGLLGEAIWTLAKYGVYGRGQDMEMLREADVIWDGRCAGLLFGISARGEEGKTGCNRGVVIRRGTVANLILALKDAKKNTTGPIFGPRQAGFRKEWHRACRALGMPWTPPPHGPRHSGPSEGAARGQAGLEQVRYSKTFALTQFRAKMPKKVLEVGPRATSDLAAEIIRAMGSRTNYSKQQRQLVDGIKENLKTKKAKDVAAELLILCSPRLRQKATNKQKSTKGEMSCPDSDDLYSDETCVAYGRDHHWGALGHVAVITDET